jgi:hypothetical protein
LFFFGFSLFSRQPRPPRNTPKPTQSFRGRKNRITLICYENAATRTTRAYTLNPHRGRKRISRESLPRWRRTKTKLKRAHLSHHNNISFPLAAFALAALLDGEVDVILAAHAVREVAVQGAFESNR